jgi:rhodanese-related sulfurtransferase
MAALKSLTPREAYAAYMLGSVLVDVRDTPSAKAKDADVKQIVKLPFNELNQRYGELPANRPVVIVSGKGNKGTEAAKFLLQNGYSDVSIVEGGMAAWEQEGFPVR